MPSISHALRLSFCLFLEGILTPWSLFSLLGLKPCPELQLICLGPRPSSLTNILHLVPRLFYTYIVWHCCSVYLIQSSKARLHSERTALEFMHRKGTTTGPNGRSLIRTPVSGRTRPGANSNDYLSSTYLGAGHHTKCFTFMISPNPANISVL